MRREHLPHIPSPMTIPQIQVSLQALTVVIFLCGLMYTGQQFRHWRRTAHVANFTRLVELQLQLRKMRVDDPDLAHMYRHDVRDMQSDREIREYFMNLMQLSVFEIAWFSHRQGQIPEDYFLSWERRMRDIASEESFQKMMDSSSMKILHDEFELYVRGLVEEVRRQGRHHAA